MRAYRKFLAHGMAILSLAAALMLSACGGGGGSGSIPAPAPNISGNVTKGVVSSSSVSVYALNTNGTRGNLLATATTDANGAWSAYTPSFPVEIVASGGTYQDEATGNVVFVTGSALSVIVPTGRTQTSVTPLTTALVNRIKWLVTNGGTLTQAIYFAEAEAKSSLGFNPAQELVPNPVNVPASATAAQKKYALALLGLSETANNNISLAGLRGLTGTYSISMALGDDLLDGAMDGSSIDGTGISVAGANLPALETTGATVIHTAAQTLITNNNLTSLTGSNFTSSPIGTSSLVDFNSSADFTNLFSPVSTIDKIFTQITTGGITGGALQTSNTGSWGNSNAKFIFPIINAPAVISSASIDFKYQGASVNLGVFERTAAINLIPTTDPNHQVTATVDPTSSKLDIITWGWVASNTPGVAAALTLNDGWYRLKLSVTNTGTASQLTLRAELFSLGANGLTAPVSIGVTTGTITDTFFASSPKVYAAFYGTLWGGSSLMDNFSVAPIR